MVWLAAYKISFVIGRGSLRHNNREFYAKNVDAHRTKNNIIYKQEPLRDAYNTLFGLALEQYNKGKKPSRQKGTIDDYMREIQYGCNCKKGNAKKKLFYECIIQIGDMYNAKCGSVEGHLVKTILDIYIKQFERRNPNLYVFNAILHDDESTPHVHCCFIPWYNSTRGLSVQNGLTKALEAMGYDKGKCRKEYNLKAWKMEERNEIRAICERFGLEISKEVSTEGRSLTVSEYRVQAQLLNKEFEKAYHEVQDIVEKNKERDILGRVINQKQIIEMLITPASKCYDIIQKYDSITVNFEQEVNRRLKKRIKLLEEKEEAINERESAVVERENRMDYIERTCWNSEYNTYKNICACLAELLSRQSRENRCSLLKKYDINERTLDGFKKDYCLHEIIK